MSERKTRLNALDIFLVVAAVLLLAFGYLRKLNIVSLEEKLSVKDVTITLTATGIDRENLPLFSVGDTVYSSDRSKLGKIGTIESIRSTPAITVSQGEDSFFLEPDLKKVDMTIRIASECAFDQNGVCYLGNKRIAPAQTVSANNGRIHFPCEIRKIDVAS